jgi:short-subunit dehydrogenase
MPARTEKKRYPHAAFCDRYGPWALVAGASKGIGAAFAELLAERGLNLVLIARNQAELTTFARDIERRRGVQVRTIAVDLAVETSLPPLIKEIENLEIGLLVYNAALSPIGPFLSLSPEDHLRVLQTNCRAPLLLTRAAAERMRQRRRGGIVLMSSFSGLQGGPWFAAYSATKAYLITLAESLREELKGDGVDVIAPIAGAVGTPTYWSGLKGRRSGVPVMRPEQAARLALKHLGRRGSVVLGLFNTISAFALNKLLGRGARTRLMGRMMKPRR